MRTIHRREDPDPWLAFQDDANLPLDPLARDSWIADTSRWSRQFLMPIIRPISKVVMGLIQLYKIIFPNALTSSLLMHGIITWGLKRFVTPEGNYLLVRHFHLGSQILEFLKHNIEGVKIETEPLYPPDLDAFKDNLILKHDINLYNFVIDLNRELKEKNLKVSPRSSFDFSDLHHPPITIEQFRHGRLNFIDIHTAIEIILPLFQFLQTDRAFWRSTQSLQLDETVGLYFANLLNMHNRLFLVNNRHPLVPAVTGEAGYRLVLHSISTEVLHAMLMELKARSELL